MLYYDVNFDVETPVQITPEEIDLLLSNTGLNSLGGSIIKLQTTYKIHPLFILGLIAEESAWGTSYFAASRNNLAGIRAYTSDPMKAEFFPSKDACLMELGYLLSNYYLQPPIKNPDGSFKRDSRGYVIGEFWEGSRSISNIFKHYSTAGQMEANTIVDIMNSEAAKLAINVSLVKINTAQKASGNISQYIEWQFKPGDSLWNIALTVLHDPSKYVVLQQINNIVDPTKIPLGTMIRVPNPNYPNNIVEIKAQMPVRTMVTSVHITVPSSTRTYTVEPIDKTQGLSGIAYRLLGNASRWHEIVALNAKIVPPNYYIHVGDVLILPK